MLRRAEERREEREMWNLEEAARNDAEIKTGEEEEREEGWRRMVERVCELEERIWFLEGNQDRTHQDGTQNDVSPLEDEEVA